MALRRLSERDLREIREDLACGIPQTLLAERYGVHQSTVSRVGKRPDYGEIDRWTRQTARLTL
jgi:predicted transcriptional regulator